MYELNIKNLGVITDSTLLFTEGFNVITGETGAGKTMLLTGVNFVSGNKINSQKIREGAAETSVEAIFNLGDNEDLKAKLEEAGVSLEEDGSVIALRSVVPGGRSRTVMGGRSVPVALLQECVDSVMTIHGQAQQARLRSSSQQRDIIDIFAGKKHGAALSGLAKVFRNWKAAHDELDELHNGKETFELKAQKMTDDLEAILKVNPVVGEEEEITSTIKQMVNSEEIKTSLAEAMEVLAPEDGLGAKDGLKKVLSIIEKFSGEIKGLQDIASQLTEAVALVDDVDSSIVNYFNAVDSNSTELDELQERKSALTTLSRRLGKNIEDIIAYKENIETFLNEGSNWEEKIAKLEEKIAGYEKQYKDEAKIVTEGRTKAVAELEKIVNSELAKLAMQDSVYKINITHSDTMTVHGYENIAMLLAGHKNASFLPIAESASGGELSRIMLAIEVALASKIESKHHTFVFDEVDAGVGGKAAIAVGQRLKELSKASQVIVVTHLAQVAAFADNHIRVEKMNASDELTSSDVTQVNGDERVKELARILSGQEDSSLALGHAQELIDMAKDH